MSDAYDVIVIGGGFAGVTAARECAKAGLRTLVLEARERLGGRTHTVDWNGTATELGGTWVHWTQAHVWAEIERYGLALADSSLPVELRSRRSDGDVAPVDFIHKLLPAVAQYFGISRQMFPRPYAPFDTGLAEQHDRVTAADPLERIDDAPTRDFLDGFVATCVGSRSSESAWVEMLRWHALSGHNYFDHVEALGRYRFRDGTKALIDAIVADGKPDVRLGEAVASVRQESGRVTLSTRSGRHFAARAVVSTLPLNVLARRRLGAGARSAQARGLDAAPRRRLDQGPRADRGRAPDLVRRSRASIR